MLFPLCYDTRLFGRGIPMSRYYYTDQYGYRCGVDITSEEDDIVVFNSTPRLSFDLKEHGIKNIYLETERLTVAELNSLKKAFDFCKVEAKEEVDEIINKLRSIKTEKEIEYIKKAQQIAEAAFEYILKFIKVGVTEKEIALGNLKKENGHLSLTEKGIFISDAVIRELIFIE